jgi:glycosyltransferase involved in cell wall biosynthesis
MTSPPRTEPDHEPPVAAVCIITYRRPVGLERLLAHLASQQGMDGRAFRTVVVDNDGELSGKPVVEAARAAGLDITYDHEPIPGIPRARNRSVEHGLRSGAQHLCILDDDEYPDAGWLAELLAHSRSSGAPVVTGPVVSLLPNGVAKWLKRSRVFSRPRHPTGTRRNRAATNNVLVHRRVFESMTSWFDESMPFDGSDDTDFFRRAHGAGFTIEWCDEAVVFEVVPIERCNLRWIERRNFRGGLAFARQSKRYDRGPAALRVLASGSLRLAFAAALSVASLGLVPRLRPTIVDSAALGAGLVLGCFGVTFDVYRRG